MLYGIFTLHRTELPWLCQDGASHVFPDAWEHFIAPVPAGERGDMMGACMKRLASDDEEAARAWSVWEGSILSIHRDPLREQGFARIECHCFVNGGLFSYDGQLIAEVGRCRHIPAVIVQGRYDICTPLRTAWDLHVAWPETGFRLVPDTGHAALEPGNIHELVCATDRFR